jgi:hypothetical protein
VNETTIVCRGCGATRLLDETSLSIADGCPCNSPRGVNHGLVPKNTCTCLECDPEQTGSTRHPPTIDKALSYPESAPPARPLKGCASEGCSAWAVSEFIAGDVGSWHCAACLAKMQRLPAGAAWDGPAQTDPIAPMQTLAAAAGPLFPEGTTFWVGTSKTPDCITCMDRGRVWDGPDGETKACPGCALWGVWFESLLPAYASGWLNKGASLPVSAHGADRMTRSAAERRAIRHYAGGPWGAEVRALPTGETK